MCLGIPGQVVGMLEGYGDQLVLVNVAGENRKVNIGMLPEETFDAGDWHWVTGRTGSAKWTATPGCTQFRLMIATGSRRTWL